MYWHVLKSYVYMYSHLRSSSTCSGTVAEPHCSSASGSLTHAMALSAEQPGARSTTQVHNQLAEELETFATLMGGYGVDKFWTYERRGYILNLPSAKAKQVLLQIKSQFEGHFEGFSGDSGARSSAGVPSSSATGANCSSALASPGAALQALARRAWASIAHTLRDEIGTDPNWRDPPEDCGEGT